MASKKNQRTPEQLKGALAAAKAKKSVRDVSKSLSSVRSDTYNAGLHYLGGSGGKRAPFIPEEDYQASLPVGSPPIHDTVAHVMERYISDLRAKPAPIPKYVIEGGRNDALRAAADGDLKNAQRIADATKMLEVQKAVWGNKAMPKTQGPKRGKKPAAKKQQGAGDGYTGDEEHNPFKRALGKVLGAPGVQTALKTVRTPYSYVASHVSDLAQEIEQGDIGGAIGALGRGVGLGAVGEVADAIQGKGFDVAGILNSYENEKNRKDFWKQTGVGEYLQRGLDKHTWDDNTILNDKWVKRGIGLAGDIALDPLTYLTPGTTKLAGTSANVATRITEAGAGLAAREAETVAAKTLAEELAKGATKEAAEAAAKTAGEDASKLAGEYIRERAATVIKKGKNRLSADDIRRIFPDEKVAGGLAWRVPFTGRVTKGLVKAGTGGRVEIEEKLIPLLNKDITNPAQRLLSKPARSLGASKLSTKLVGKFGGELGAELRDLIRSGDPETVYKGLGIKRALNVMRSRASSGVRVHPEDLRALFPDSEKLLIGEGEHLVGPSLPKLWMKEVAPAIKGREKEIMQAIESGNIAGVEGAEKVVNFYRAARNSLERQGAVFGDIGDEYIPRIFTEEGRKALQDLAGDVPEGTIAIDPKVAFMNHRATLEELGVRTQDEARALLETVYGKNLKGGQVFEPDLNKIAAQYIRMADQQQGRQALIKELEGWGIALKHGEAERYIGMAGEETPKVVANRIVNKAMGSAPLAKKRAAQRAVQSSLEDAVASGEAPLVEEATTTAEGLSGRLRTPAGAPVTPEEQAAIDALSAGVSGEPIPASEVLNPEYTGPKLMPSRGIGGPRASDVVRGPLGTAQPRLFYSPDELAGIGSEAISAPDAYAARVQAARNRLEAWKESVGSAKERIAQLKNGANQDIYRTLDFFGYQGSLNDPVGMIEHLQSTRDALIESGTRADNYAAQRLQEHIDRLIQYPETGFRHEIGINRGGTFTPQVIPDNPTIADLNLFKETLDDAINATAENFVPKTAYEASLMANPQEGMKILEAKQAYSDAVANHLRNVVSDTAATSIVRNVDKTTGEIIAGGTESIEETLATLRESPHWPEIEKQLETLGAAERRAIAESDRPLEGLGRYGDLTSDAKFNPDDTTTWGSNFDAKAADAEGDISGLTHDEITRRIKNTRKEIQNQNRLLESTPHSQKNVVRKRLAQLQDELDQLDYELWREGGPSDIAANKGREAGVTDALTGQVRDNFDSPAFFGKETSLHRQSFSAEDLAILQRQRNLGDVYLGVQRMLEDADRVGMEVGQRTYLEMDRLAGVSDTLFKQRLEMGAQHFNLPNSDVLTALEQKFSGNPDALEAAILDRSGTFVKNFYTTKQQEIAARIEETLSSFEKNSSDIVGGASASTPSTAAPSATDFDPVQRLAELQRQRAELHAALYSGDPNEMVRVMLKHSIEGVGGDEMSSVASRKLDEFAQVIRSGNTDGFDSAMSSLELPPHPMGEGQLTGAARPRPDGTSAGPYRDPVREMYVKQQEWDTQNGMISQRAKQLQKNAAARGGVWHSNEIDELRALKIKKEALGPRPSAEAEQVRAIQAAADRTTRQHEATLKMVNEMRDAGRIGLRGSRTVGFDPEAQATLDNLRRMEEQAAQGKFSSGGAGPWKVKVAGGRVYEPSFQESDAVLVREQKPLLEARRELTDKYGTSKIDTYDAADKAEAQRLQKEIKRIDDERKMLKKDFRQGGTTQVPKDFGGEYNADYLKGEDRGIQLAEIRIREDRVDEAISQIEKRLAGSEKLSDEIRGMLDGGLKRLQEHKTAIEKTAAEVASKGGVLEVSTASSEQLGKDLSAFNLHITTPEGVETSVESAYHGAKIWTGPNGEQIGPHPEWANLTPAEAKKLASRIQAKNTLAGFEYGGTSYPADGTSTLYDQLYRQGFDAYIQHNPDALDRLLGYSGFTDKFARKGSVAKQNETLQRIVDELRSAKRGTFAGGGMYTGDRFPFNPLGTRRGIYFAPDTGAGGGVPPNPVRASVGGSESAQDALNAAADLSQPEAALDDTAAVVSGRHDDELIASMDEVHDDPATPNRKRKFIRQGRDWIKSKKNRVAAANVAANGDPAAEAAIAMQSQAENAGILRYMKYPTSDPVETFKRLNNLKVIEDSATMVEESAGRLAWLQQSQGYVTDADTAAILNQVKKVNTPEGMQTFLKYYDKFMTYIKAWQLTTPGFHVRNTMGGIFNNYLADVDIASTSRFLKNLQKFKAGKLTGEEAEWMKIIYEHAGSGQYSHHEIGLASSVGSTYNPLSPRFKMLAGSAHFGGDVEFRLRGALMWDRLSKGRSLQEALDDVTRYHFDYSNLSNFETGVVKRIIPFYVWTRYNFPLQLEMMATSPAKYRFYQQFKHTMENRADKGKPVPEFLKNEMFGIPLPTHIGGGQNFLALDLPFTRTMAGATPDVENWDPKKLGSYPTLLDPYASQMAVPLKLPAELALSRQFFKGIPLKDTSRTEGYGVGGYGPAATALGGRTKADYITEQLMPLYGQLRRLRPTEKKNKEKLFTNWASYLGVPLRTNTKLDQQNELMRRSFLR